MKDKKNDALFEAPTINFVRFCFTAWLALSAVVLYYQLNLPYEFTLPSALHDQCGHPPSMASPVNPGVGSTGRKLNQGHRLRTTNCSRTPYTKRGFRTGGPDHVFAELVPDGPTTNPPRPRERVSLRQNCSGNVNARELRKTCKRSFVLRTAVGFVEVKCGETLWAGMANPASECSQANFSGLMLVVQPDLGIVTAAHVDDQMRYHGLAVMAAFPDVSACSNACTLGKQPWVRALQYDHGEETWWTTWWGPKHIPTDAMLDPSTPELKLLASAITTVSKEERIRERGIAVVVPPASEVFWSVLTTMILFYIFTWKISPSVTLSFYSWDAPISASLSIFHGILLGYHHHLWKFATLIEVDTTTSLCFTLCHLTCYILLVGRVVFPLEMVHLGLAMGVPKEGENEERLKKPQGRKENQTQSRGDDSHSVFPYT